MSASFAETRSGASFAAARSGASFAETRACASFAAARACANIALVKYWGKRDPTLNLPARGSLSLTLDGLTTVTRVRFGPLAADRLVLGGVEQTGEPLRRVSELLDLVRARAGCADRAEVVSENSFPSASGLASSASAFAALAAAAAAAAGLDLTPAELSVLARRGSVSAARSICGGFVELDPGVRPDGADAFARTILAPEAWDLRLVVAQIGDGQKAVLSRPGMEHTRRTSPYYAAWLDTVPGDLAAARAAVAARDLEALGAVAEASALAMHAACLAARPALTYLRGPTLDALAEVRALRAGGVAAWATVDAGPHVKVLCPPEQAAHVAAALQAVPGVTATRICRPGSGVEILPEPR
jgi:diphosphomevalonate decarboxylase